MRAGVISACAVSSSVANTTGRPHCEQDRQRFGVAPGVEFGGGRDVALGPGAAHQHDLLRPVRAKGRFGGQGEGQIGGGADADQRDRFGRLAQDAADRVGGKAGGGRAASRQHDAAQAVSPWTGSRWRTRPAAGDRRRRRPGPSEPARAVSAQRVGQRVLQPDIAAGHGDGEHRQFRRGERQQDGQRIVGARVAVEDDVSGQDTCSLQMVCRHLCTPIRQPNRRDRDNGGPAGCGRLRSPISRRPRRNWMREERRIGP